MALSFAYLTASLALWPVKNELNKKSDDYIARGEIGWLLNKDEG